MAPLRILIPTLLLVACGVGPRVVQVPGKCSQWRSGRLYRDRPRRRGSRSHGGRCNRPAPGTCRVGRSASPGVALFDATSGARVDQAEVVVTHLSPRRQPVRRTLSPMRIGDVISFGGEFGISKGPGHLFEIEARRPGAKSACFSFGYDNRHQ